MQAVAAWAWACVALFVVGCAAKAVRYARMPMHLRWELHPLASADDPDATHAAVSGSAAASRWRRLVVEARFILKEVTTLAMVRRHNPTLWPASLAFHWGVYLLFLLGAGAVATAMGLIPGAAAGLAVAVVPWQLVGMGLATLGTVALLFRRIADPVLRGVSTPSDYVHLGLVLAALLASWGRFLWADRTLATTVVVLRGSPGPRPAGWDMAWAGAEVALVAFFLAYLPFSRMTHFFTKFFAWHMVRWDDRENRDGARFASDLARQLGRPVGWQAPHVGGGRWRDVVKRSGER
jgi:nitrate reductase gamma subunit